MLELITGLFLGVTIGFFMAIVFLGRGRDDREDNDENQEN